MVLQEFKKINDIDRLSPSTLFSKNTDITESSTKGHDQKFVKRRLRLGSHQPISSQRVVKCLIFIGWNSLTIMPADK